MSNSTESKRRALFCCHYARLGDVAEAARCAGYPPETAAADGAAILRQQCYRRMVANYRSVLHDDPAAAVRAGLERLAFGRSNDAIGLLLAEEPPGAAAVQALDLFPVSSVKRDKNGGMEIHFFDRLKALTALYEYGGDADGKAAAHALLTALSGRPARARPQRRALTMAWQLVQASRPQRSTQALPAFRASAAASEVTLGRLS